MEWALSSEEKDRESVLRIREHQVSSTVTGLTGNTSKQGASNVQTSFSVGGEVLRNPRGHLEQKSAPNPQQEPLRKEV